MKKQRTEAEKRERRDRDLWRRVQAEDLKWHREEIQPLINSGMSYDEAFVAAGETIIIDMEQTTAN